MKRERIIFHVDVNSAFLSWEAARRVAGGEPDIRDIPSAIGGERTKRTGVILAKSIPAKKYGITTGEPVSAALRKCPDLLVLPPDFRLYKKSSEAFVAICKKYAPAVEQFSIDECFLDMTGTDAIYPNIEDIAYKIKDEIRSSLGFTVNIGIGSNKLLAKMASDFEKPDRVHTLYSHEIPTKLWHLPVEEMFTIGAATAEKLKNGYINTVGDLAKMDVKVLRIMLGEKLGDHLFKIANGIDNSPVLEIPEEAKGYSNSTTLENDILDMEDACRILLSLVDITAFRMRADGVRAHRIGVTIRSSSFNDKTHQRKLSYATDITNEIYEICCQLLSELWDKKTPLRLLGVSLSELSREEDIQISFFDTENKDKARNLDKAADELRQRFGTAAVLRGGAYWESDNIAKKHKAKFDKDKEE